MPSLQSHLATRVLKSTFKMGSRLQAGMPVSLVRLATEAGAGASWVAWRPRRRPLEEPGIRGEWLEPRGALPGAVLFLHGGGYFFGSPRTHRPLTAALAQRGRLPVLSLDYRLAPEHPFPAALEDALAAWRHLRGLGLEARQIALAGDSAGGGLALAMMMALRDGGEDLPAAAACFSPWTDLACTGESLRSNDPHCAMFHGTSLPAAARHYLAGQDPTHPLVSPLYGNLRGLPPLLVHVSETEVLRDDSTRLAARAVAAGVDVRLRIWPGVPHSWQLYPWLLPEARASLDEAGAFLRQGVARPEGPSGTRLAVR